MIDSYSEVNIVHTRGRIDGSECCALRRANRRALQRANNDILCNFRYFFVVLV